MRTQSITSSIGIVLVAIITAIALAMAPVSAGGPSRHSKPAPPDSFESKSMVVTKIENKNDVDVTNGVIQMAKSGSVDVHRIDDLKGNVSTGAAANSAAMSTAVAVSNTAKTPAPAAATPSGASYKDFDKVELSSKTYTNVENKNDVDVTNGVIQMAASGSVDLGCLDDVTGNVTTGAATNTATISNTITASNQ